LVEKSVSGFLDEVASQSPAPGGGSVAALSGALAAGLVSMVCRLTIGKKKYAAVEADMRVVLEKSEKLRGRLTQLIDEDTAAFDAVMAAIKSGTGGEEASKKATEVPLETARLALEVAGLGKTVFEKGNRNSLSDAEVSVIMACAAVKGAGRNVRINLGSIQDADFKKKAADDIGSIEQKASEIKESVLGHS
jgi:formiminotetrahydrofolate cyclodeaminase